MEEKDIAAREAALAEKEAQLTEREQRVQKKEDEIIYKGAKERLYDKIHVPVKVLDILIIASIAIIVLIFIFGRQ